MIRSRLESSSFDDDWQRKTIEFRVFALSCFQLDLTDFSSLGSIGKCGSCPGLDRFILLWRE